MLPTTFPDIFLPAGIHSPNWLRGYDKHIINHQHSKEIVMSDRQADPETRSKTLNLRHARLAVSLQTAGLDALALNPGPSLAYLTGLEFHLMERPIVGLFRPHSPLVLILPELESGKLSDYPLPIQTFTYGDNPAAWPKTFHLGLQAARLDPARIGIEPGRLRVLELRYLEEATKQVGFVSAENVIEDLRTLKDGDELAAIQQAVDIAQAALQATLPKIKIGMTERAIASLLTLKLLEHGSDRELPFTPIVASGPNAANPHAVPGERRLQAGDLLIIDWGARYAGYISDITRTFAVGDVDPELETIAAAVHQANLAAQAVARPGISAGAVDYAARQVIDQAGYGRYFMHRTGHGFGLEGHEPPYLFAENELELAAGMTFTIEPGIYLPGRAGVRIEDNIVATAEGARCLTSLPRELVRVG
jgi:Xaa-Pro dipeptidase